MSTLWHGDCLDVLRTLPDASVDSVVTDPPAGIGFMGQQWDHDKGGRAAWVAWLAEVMVEVRRVAKPGAHGLVWALPRTAHWTMTAIEDAGWECRDVVAHVFAEGFPKSLDVSKAIDKAAGAEREVVGIAQGAGSTNTSSLGPYAATYAATVAAQRWQGWGTALKPAAEFWVLCRKPLSERSVAANVLRWGTGALNIDASRVGTGGGGDRDGEPSRARRYQDRGGTDWAPTPGPRGGAAAGRWPSNLVLSHAEGCVEVGTRTLRSGVSGTRGWQTEYVNGEPRGAVLPSVTYNDADGTETIPAWECTPSCPVAEMDRQSGTVGASGPASGPMLRGGNDSVALGHRNGLPQGREPAFHGDTGGASRFFPTFPGEPPFAYVPKASTAERRGANMVERSSHPTVKPVALLSWLINLVTPVTVDDGAGGTRPGCVLDPFLGSGSTAVAAIGNGFDWIGIEREAEYVAIAQQRIGLGCVVRTLGDA